MRINLKLLTLCYVKKLLIIGSRKKYTNKQIVKLVKTIKNM